MSMVDNCLHTFKRRQPFSQLNLVSIQRLFHSSKRPVWPAHCFIPSIVSISRPLGPTSQSLSLSYMTMPPKRKAEILSNAPVKRGTRALFNSLAHEPDIKDEHHEDDKSSNLIAKSKSKPHSSLATSNPQNSIVGQANGAPNHEDFILREFYPAEMTNERVQAYRDGTIQLPFYELITSLIDTKNQRADISPGKAVAHWFRWDLRLCDNTSLHHAYESARSKGIPLVCLYVYSHEDFQAHYRSPARINFGLRTLEILKADLGKLDIPLWVENVEKRKDLQGAVIAWCKKWGINELHGNMEYEVDELRRDARLVRAGVSKDLAIHIHHDTCVVEPQTLRSGSGKTYSVFSPYFKSWEPYLYKKKLVDNLYPPPQKIASKLNTREYFKELFEQESLPTPSKLKRLNETESKRLPKLWPAGERAARERLESFLDSGVSTYAARRDRPDIEGATSALSVHFSAGTLSVRQAVRACIDHNKGKSLDAGHHGWIRELCFRDFYREILVSSPWVCMNKAYREEYHNVVWEYDEDHFKRWTEGKTGYPIVDAGMRQLNAHKYMHNRCRMIVASFLCKHLLLDWRKGERYFMEHLIDGDFASNNAGWQFCSSSGTDASPYFRIFNPKLQSEKFDPDGDFIRHWVPELANVQGKAIHDPFSQLSKAEFQKLGYPEPMVEHKFARDRALERYKSGLKRDTR